MKWNASKSIPSAIVAGIAEPLAGIGIDVQDTTAEPIEPMAGYYRAGKLGPVTAYVEVTSRT